MLSGPLAFYTLEVALRDAIVAALTTPIQDARIVPGAIPWDNCSCGMLALSVGRTFFSEVFPTEVATGQNVCGVPLQVGDVTIQVIRCAPGPDVHGHPPTAAAQDASAQQVITDMYEAVTAVVCKLQDMADAGDIDDYLVRPAVVQGPSGQCVGPEFTATVSLWR